MAGVDRLDLVGLTVGHDEYSAVGRESAVRQHSDTIAVQKANRLSSTVAMLNPLQADTFSCEARR